MKLGLGVFDVRADGDELDIISFPIRGGTELSPPDEIASPLLRALQDMSLLVWRIAVDGRLVWTNRKWFDFTGLAPGRAKGVDWLEAVHPEDLQTVQLAWSRALADREMWTVNCRLHCAETDEYRWFQSRGTPVTNGSDVIEWLGSSTDVEDLMRSQNQQRVVVAELQHRSRNLLGVVRSVSGQLASTSIDMETFRARFEDRLAAMARVQDLLARVEVGSISFSEVLEVELRAVGADLGGRIVCMGPRIDLPGAAVQIIALAMHELATNALKHGALSHQQGLLEVRWNVEKKEPWWLHIHWLEHHPPDSNWRSSNRRGYGRELLEIALPYQLGASTELAITASGVSCAISLPLQG